MDIRKQIASMQLDYCRAVRCWTSNNLKSCLLLCGELSQKLSQISSKSNEPPIYSLLQLKQLVWFLKLKCLADEYNINESFLLNEEDIDSEDQVRVLTSAKTSILSRTFSNGTTGGISRARITTGGPILESRQRRTGILTGRMPSASSRQSYRAGSSYRPLTMNLTASQTAFSQSTRPLLKYSKCSLLSKLIYEYLYNSQTNWAADCPDYRQCLDYLNMVQSSSREKDRKSNPKVQNNFLEGRKQLDIFWLISFGTCYLNLHMNKEAEEYFQLAIAKSPKHLESYAWLIKIYLRSNQMSKLMQICDLGLKLGKSSTLYNWKARVQSLFNDLYGANASLKEALVHNPTNIEALTNVAYFAFYSGKTDQSLRCYQRIRQLSVISFRATDNSELLNNLALNYLQCGYYHKVMPLFNKALLVSPSKEITSDIWYNISFVPLSCGFKNLAIACLRLALKNDSKNEEAANNLGALKYDTLINQLTPLDVIQDFPRKHPLSELELKNLEDHNEWQAKFDEAETYFAPSTKANDIQGSSQANLANLNPEMLYNLALIKKSRGQLMVSANLCRSYLEHDPGNSSIMNIMREIRDLVSHDS